MSESAPLGLKLAAGAGLAFIHIPLAFIVLYAFTSEDRSYQFPPPGYTLKWFAVAFGRQDVFDALRLSIAIAALSTLVALVLGTLAAAALSRARFGRESISLPGPADRTARYHHRYIAPRRLRSRRHSLLVLTIVSPR
jgi:putative spermidine/putrescine transport system permease protein